VERLVLDHGDLSVRHLLPEPCSFHVVEVSGFALEGRDGLLLGAVGGGDEAAEPAEAKEQADLPDAARGRQRDDDLGGQDDAVEEPQTNFALAERDDGRVSVDVVPPRKPPLQRGPRDVESVGEGALAQAEARYRRVERIEDTGLVDADVIALFAGSMNRKLLRRHSSVGHPSTI
jgi:hypothetical protein